MKEVFMNAAIRQAKAKTGAAEELARGRAPFRSSVMLTASWPIMSSMRDTVTAIRDFNNFAGAEEASRRALAGIEQNLGPLLVGPATAVAGLVIVQGGQRRPDQIRLRYYNAWIMIFGFHRTVRTSSDKVFGTHIPRVTQPSNGFQFAQPTERPQKSSGEPVSIPGHFSRAGFRRNLR
jgi:hypothetical protein